MSQHRRFTLCLFLEKNTKTSPVIGDRGGFALDQIKQRIDALPHIDGLPTHEVPVIGI